MDDVESDEEEDRDDDDGDETRAKTFNEFFMTSDFD